MMPGSMRRGSWLAW